MTRYSVAIATYNRAHILPETLGYIAAQTLRPCEIVIVDDGSADNTPAAVQAFASESEIPVKSIRINNAGPGAALKTAIESCSEEWIALCDDDDKWHPDHLERRARLIDAQPDVDFTFSNFSSFGEESIKGFDEFNAMPQDWWRSFSPKDNNNFQRLGSRLLPNFLNYNPVFPTSVCLKKDLYTRCGGIDAQFSRLGCWDEHFTWRCVMHGVTACDHNITVETRKHGKNFSKKRSYVNLERAQMLEQAWKDGWIPNVYANDISTAILNSKITALNWAWRDKDHELIRKVGKSVALFDLPVKLVAKVVASYFLGLRPVK